MASRKPAAAATATPPSTPDRPRRTPAAPRKPAATSKSEAKSASDFPVLSLRPSAPAFKPKFAPSVLMCVSCENDDEPEVPAVAVHDGQALCARCLDITRAIDQWDRDQAI